ncbi:MAG: chromosome segregation protein SMC, partial [Pseudomonadota bacterium]
IAAAVLQRLQVQRDTLDDQEKAARDMIDRLQNRIAQLAHDIERETGLNRDAGETIERLEWEAKELAKASDGHAEALEAASETARASATVLQDRETELSEKTEDTARLAARHQSAARYVSDCVRAVEQSARQAETARAAMAQAEEAVAQASTAFDAAGTAEVAAKELVTRAEQTLAEAEAARARTQGEEADARAVRSEANGEASALRAEVQALGRLVDRDTGTGDQLIDRVGVAPGYEKALGAALADDLKAPVLAGRDGSGWIALPDYPTPQALPAGVTPLAQHVTLPDVLQRRMSQVGLVDAADGPRLQAALLPGQRLVSPDGDVWRWDGFAATAEDAPSAAALRLEQKNRLTALRADLETAEAKASEAEAAHATLAARLKDLTAADQAARQARRAADQQMADAARALSKAEADRTLAAGKVETLSLAATRHDEEHQAALAQQAEAEKQQAALPDLAAFRAQLEDVKLTVEAARVTMLAHRTAHDELRRAGEARVKRGQEITKELSGWKHRLETATTRTAELQDRKVKSEAELADATAAP